MRRLIILILSSALLLLALAPDHGEAQKRRKRDRTIVKVSLEWNLGSDRRGEIHVHGCSVPPRNSQSTGACFEFDLIDEHLVDFEGSTTLRIKEGQHYNVCFVADDTLGRPGRWGACKVFPATSGAAFKFTEDDFEYWYGGAWQEP